MEKSRCAFMCHLPLDEIDNLVDAITSYDPEGNYLICHEEDPSHFHVLTDFDDEQWVKFRNNILVKRYKLRGQAKKNMPSQYGKIQTIRDIERLLSYMLKDQGERRTNVDKDSLTEYIEKSFKKPDDRNHIEKAIETLPALEYKYEYKPVDIQIIKIMIIDYYKKNNLEINWLKLDRVFNMYLMRQSQLSASQCYDILRLVRKEII